MILIPLLQAQPSAPPVPPPKQPARNSQAAPKPAGKGNGRSWGQGWGVRAPPDPPPSGVRVPLTPNPLAAQQQLEFLELRRRQLAQAALRAKRRNDLEGAKLLLRRAKGVEGLLEAARGGLPVDIAQVRPRPSLCPSRIPPLGRIPQDPPSLP